MSGTTWRVARATLSVADASPRVLHDLAHRLEPIAPERPEPEATADTTRADVTLAWRRGLPESVLEIEGDAGDGRTAVRTRDATWLVRGAGRASLPEPGAGPAAIEVHGAFPLRPLLAELVYPALQQATLRHGAVCVHGAGAVVDGRGLLFAGWSESGKTEAALAALEAGGDLVSDKWTVLGADDSLGTFPGAVSVRPWVVPYLGTLGTRLSRIARARLEAGRAAGRLLPGIERHLPSLPAGDVLAPAVARGASLATRYTIGLQPLRELYGRRGELPHPTLDVAVLLTPGRVSAPVVREADPVRVAARLAASATFERRAWWELARRRAYLDPTATDPTDAERAARDREQELIRNAIARRCVLQVTARFPGDPRRVVDAIGPWL